MQNPSTVRSLPPELAEALDLAVRMGPPRHFRTVRELFLAVADHRRALAHAHRALAAHVGGRSDCAMLFTRLAEADEALARGLVVMADDPDPIYDTFVQYGSEPRSPEWPDPYEPHVVLRWADELDESMRDLWRPLRGSAAASRLHELLDRLDEQVELRRRARTRWVTLETI